jgi:aryl-alcohol dehydrogenase-like predicted oxidoreductase
VTPAIALGSAQFGMDYSISNTAGRTTSEEVGKILRCAVNKEISCIDTASMYGISEMVLGEQSPAGSDFKFVTKTPSLRGQKIAADQVLFVEDTFEKSLAWLQRQSIYGILVHHVDDLLDEDGQKLFSLMTNLKKAGKVQKVGTSAYTVSQIEAVIERFDIDIVQVPLNVLDQRFADTGTLSKLKAEGVEIHVRSAFLQGLLLMPEEDIPEYFEPIKDVLKRYHSWCKKLDLTPLEAALAYVHQQTDVDQIVVGVCDCQQLLEITKGFEKAANLDHLDFSSFALIDDTFINPAKWPKT